MKVLVSHPTGNANVRAVANGFFAHGILDSFHTSIASFPHNIWDRLSQLGSFADFKRRAFDAQLAPITRIYPLKEVGRMVANKVGLSALAKHETGFFSVDAMYHYHDAMVARALEQRRNVTAVYAYEDGALETFQAAKRLGIRCIYDLPIAYWETGRALMQAEAIRLPLWTNTLGGGIKDSQAKLDRKSAEIALADTVIVPSSFVRDSLPIIGGVSKPFILSPFGSPKFDNTIPVIPKDLNAPLRVLFVGSMGQRKGLGDLFEAIKLLGTKQVELVVLGSLLEPLSFYQSILPNFTYESGRSHAEVLALMHTCDVFCLPSIVEGRALVVQEAMSQGLPIIITKNTGGEDLVLAGETGFMVPIQSPLAIAEKIAYFLANREAVVRMGEQARLHAASYTWNQYVTQIVKSLNTSF